MPTEVRVAAIVLFTTGGLVGVLALMSIGILLSGIEVDPAAQGGTGYLDMVLFFNGVLCLSPVGLFGVYLGVRLRRADRAAWFAAYGLVGFCLLLVLLAVAVLGWGLGSGLTVVAVAAGEAALLSTPASRRWFAEPDDG